MQMASRWHVATRGRQGRFLLVVLIGWVMARAYLLQPAHIAMAIPTPLASAHRFRTGVPADALDIAVVGQAGTGSTAPAPPLVGSHAPRRKVLSQPPDGPAIATARRENKGYPDTGYSFERSPAPPSPMLAPRSARRLDIEAQAYLFWRPGATTTSLAERGELGGSQIAARIAVPLSPHLAAAARLYAPLEHPGAEAAIGLDWRPLPKQAFRISIERRQRLDSQGRSGWSAYAAGGFWRRAGPVELDGYAQAGIVGTQRRDLFIDGALRIGYRLPIKHAVTVGAGVWGAAQPDVERVDAGPRMAVTLPVDKHRLTLAVDGRFRVAGNAAPGSGAALTLAADF